MTAFALGIWCVGGVLAAILECLVLYSMHLSRDLGPLDFPPTEAQMAALAKIKKVDSLVRKAQWAAGSATAFIALVYFLQIVNLLALMWSVWGGSVLLLAYFVGYEGAVTLEEVDHIFFGFPPDKAKAAIEKKIVAKVKKIQPFKWAAEGLLAAMTLVVIGYYLKLYILDRLFL